MPPGERKESRVSASISSGGPKGSIMEEPEAEVVGW